MKSVFPLIARPRIVKSVRFLIQIYEQNKSPIENYLSFHRFEKINKICAQLILLDYGWCFIVIITSPLMIYMLSGSRETILPIYFPGMSLDSIQHYIINMIPQSFLCALSAVIYAYFDLLFVVQLLHVILMTDILRQKARAISQMAAASRQTSHVEISLNLRNVINLHNEMRW